MIISSLLGFVYRVLHSFYVLTITFNNKFLRLKLLVDIGALPNMCFAQRSILNGSDRCKLIYALSVGNS